MVDFEMYKKRYGIIIAVVFLLFVGIVVAAPSETGYLSFGKFSFWKSTSSGSFDTEEGTASTVSISATPSSPTQGQTVTFSATASGSSFYVKISKISIYVDSKNVKNCYPNAQKGSCSYSTASLATGSHTYYAIGTDSYSKTFSSGSKSIVVFAPAQTTSTGQPTIFSNSQGVKLTKIGKTYSDCVGTTEDQHCLERPGQLGLTCGDGKIDQGENYFTCQADVQCIGKEILGKCAAQVKQTTLPNGKKIFVYFDDAFNDPNYKTKTLGIIDDQINRIYNNYIQDTRDSTYILFFAREGGAYAYGFYTDGVTSYVGASMVSASISLDPSSIRHELTHDFQFSSHLLRGTITPGMWSKYLEGMARVFGKPQFPPSLDLKGGYFSILRGAFITNIPYSETLGLAQYANSYETESLWIVYYLWDKNFFKHMASAINKGPAIPNELLYKDISAPLTGLGYLGSSEHLKKIFVDPNTYKTKNILEGPFLGMDFKERWLIFSYGKYDEADGIMSLKGIPAEFDISLLSFDGRYKYTASGTASPAASFQIPESQLPQFPQAGTANVRIKLLDGSNRILSYQKTWATDIYVMDINGKAVNGKINIKPNKLSSDRNSYANIQLSNGMARLNVPLDIRDIEVVLNSGKIETFTNVIVPSSFAILKLSGTSDGGGGGGGGCIKPPCEVMQ